MKVSSTVCFSRMLLLALFAVSFLCPSKVFGAITLANGKWNSTFNCADWDQGVGVGNTLSCDGMENNNYQNTCASQISHLNSAGNNASGGGGKGFREVVCSGTNADSGSITFHLTSAVPELWFRWYSRWPAGFAWSGNSIHYNKTIYFDAPPFGNSPNVLVEQFMNDMRFYDQDHSVYHDGTGTGGWQTVQGSTTGDGLWHYYEIHVKTDTNGSNGIFQTWVDGNLVSSHSDINYNGRTFDSWSMQINQDSVATSWGWVDFDDVAISTTGYIGSLGGGGDAAAPTAPTNLSATAVSSSQINLTWTASTDAVGVAGYNVYRGGSLVGTSATNSYSSTGLSPSTLYTYTISAYDAAGNTSAQSSSPATATTQAQQAQQTQQTQQTQTVLFTETFEDTNLVSRGWYDSPSGAISATEHAPGSSHSFQCDFAQGASGCTGGNPNRHLFTPTDDLTVEYWVKHSSNWVGSGKSYHPHLFYILSDLDGDYDALAWNYLQTYLEENSGKLRIATQDGRNINPSPTPPWANTGGTENRAVAGCNGDSDGYGNISCYQSGNWYNGKYYDTASIYFSDSAGAYYKGDWHKVKAHMKMNTIIGGIAQANGVMQWYYDDVLVMDHQNVMYRTGQHPTMKWHQFIIGAWIGDGSPVAQTIWFDNLTVWTTTAASQIPMTPTSIQIR